jgi:hypothetical protein
MFIPFIFAVLVIVGVIYFLIMAGKRKSEGKDLADQDIHSSNPPSNDQSVYR